jgi:hypothetical protein
MTALNNANFDAALKILYREGIEQAVLKESPFLAMCDKRLMPGKSRDLVINIAHQGASPSFTVAQARKNASTPRAFRVTRSKLYVLGSIDGETDDSSAGGGAVAAGLKTILDQKLQEFSHALSYSVWNNTGGSIGRVGTVATTRITLATVTDHVNFNVGDELEFSATDGTSGSVKAGTGTVTAVDRKNGYLDTDTNWSTQVPTISDSPDDYIFKEGTFGNSIAGVLAWVPPTDAPAALFGVTRTEDPTRLAGIKYSASNQDIESAIIDAQARAFENNAGELDVLYMGPRRYATLLKSLQGKATYEKMTGGNMSGTAKVSYEAVKVGNCKVMRDPYCPDALGLMTKSSGVWTLGHTKSGVPHFDTKDGNKLSREPSSDAHEFRLKAYCQLMCENPLENVLITW